MCLLCAGTTSPTHASASLLLERKNYVFGGVWTDERGEVSFWGRGRAHMLRSLVIKRC